MCVEEFTEHVARSECNFFACVNPCTFCPSSFAFKDQLDDHLKLHRLGRFFCQKYCGKYFKSVDDCDQHEYIDHKYDQYKCEVSHLNIKEIGCIVYLK